MCVWKINNNFKYQYLRNYTLSSNKNIIVYSAVKEIFNVNSNDFY